MSGCSSSTKVYTPAQQRLLVERRAARERDLMRRQKRRMLPGHQIPGPGQYGGGHTEYTWTRENWMAMKMANAIGKAYLPY